MPLSDKLDDADLKSRLSRFGINQPITKTTRNVLLKKLLKLEMDFEKEKNNRLNSAVNQCYKNKKINEMDQENVAQSLSVNSASGRSNLHTPVSSIDHTTHGNKTNCFCYLYDTNKYTIMSSRSSNTLDDADLKSRLARFGINQPITKTTRNVLLKKLLKLEMDFEKEKNTQSIKFGCELMDTTTNDLNEYEIRDGISKHGLNQVPLTDSTRPVISNIIRKKNQNF